MSKALLCILCLTAVSARAEIVLNCVQETTQAELDANLRDWERTELVPGVEVKSLREGRARAERGFKYGFENLLVPGDCITVLADPTIISKFYSTELRLCVLFRGKVFGRNCPEPDSSIIGSLSGSN